VIQYLDECKSQAQSLRQEVASQLSDTVHKDELSNILGDKWQGTYKIRALVNPGAAKA